jgi:hypothetical protein
MHMTVSLRRSHDAGDGKGQDRHKRNGKHDRGMEIAIPA